ncbi:MAG: SRPBCC family protein, partial [Ktedonobacterales bacterium]
GLPVTGYRGEVRLNAVEAGTQLIWTGTFEPRVPGTSWLIAGFFRMAITLLARRAIAIAEKPTADR